MPETHGKLEGLRDIIPPDMPVLEYQLPWMLILMILAVLILVFIGLKHYRQDPLRSARRQFRQLLKKSVGQDPVATGEAITSILRTYCNTHNLANVDLHGIERRDWLKLLDDCNHLRFSARDDKSGSIQRALEKTQQLLWRTA